MMRQVLLEIKADMKQNLFLWWERYHGFIRSLAFANLQVSSGVERGDEPVLPLSLLLLGCEEVEDVLVPQVRIGEDVLLVLPGSVFLVREDLHGHRLKLIRRVLLQFSLVHLSEATFSHLWRQHRLRIREEV